MLKMFVKIVRFSQQDENNSPNTDNILNLFLNGTKHLRLRTCRSLTFNNVMRNFLFFPVLSGG